MRKFNVYSPLIVVYPGETFEWELAAGEAPSVVVSPTSSWPLTAPSYTVTAGTPLQATVQGTLDVPGEFTFQCDPSAPNVTTQTIALTAAGEFDVCGDVSVNPGNYFIWKNNTAGDVTITPDTDDGFWPLPSQSHVVQAGNAKAVLLPGTADKNKEYPLTLTFATGDGCPQATQPKIIVGGSGV